MTTEIYLKGGNNRYVIVEEKSPYMKLKCVWFCNAEDLGDLIFCTEEGEEIWVCEYHYKHYVREEVDLYVV